MPIRLSAEAQRIKRVLCSHVGSRWKPGDRLPPIRRLAGELGTGYVNTHRAVKDLATLGWLESRRGAGTFIARRLADPGQRAAMLAGLDKVPTRGAGGVTPRADIGLLMPGPQADGFVSEMIEAFERTIELAGHSCRRVAWPRHNPETLVPDALSALVFINPSPTPVIAFDPRQVAVAINTAAVTPFVMPGRFDVVSTDHEQGGLLAGHLARDLGCTNACFIGVGRPTYDLTSTLRLTGFEHGWGRAVPASHRLTADCYGAGAGARVFRSFLQMKKRPDLIFAASDDIAIGVVTGAMALGLTAGEDYQVIGFDGQHAGKTMDSGPLTTVQAPLAAMGIKAAEFLLDRLIQPDQPVRRLSLGCELSPGVTTGRRKDSARS